MYIFFQGTLCRLGSLRVTTSNSYYYKKINEFGKDFKEDVLNAVKLESKRLERIHDPEMSNYLEQPCDPPSRIKDGKLYLTILTFNKRYME